MSVILATVAALVLCGLLAASLNRGLLILLMLLPASQFLGFVDPMAIAVKGAFDIHALLAILMALTVVISVRRWSDLRHAQFVKPMAVFALLWLYGVLFPIAQGHASLFYALKGSKEFLAVFAYFAVFLFVRNDREIRWGWYVVLGLGLYYALLEAVAQVFGPSLLSHMVYAFRKEMLFWKIYPPFWPVILIAFLHAYYEYALGVRRAFVRIGIGCVGLLLTFFRSYLLGTAVAVPALMWLSRQGALRTVLQGTMVGTVIAVSILGVGAVAGNTDESYEKLSQHFIFSGIEEFSSQSGGAIKGREVYASERREILDQSPYLGFGFIDKDSALGQLVRRDITGDMLGFIDKGDLDAALKFGQVGRAVLYAAALFVVYLLVKLVRRHPAPTVRVRALTVATTVLVFLMVQPVHAPLTHSFGLLPLGIVLGLLDRECLLYRLNQGQKP